MNPTLTFIGRIHSPLKRLEDCPLQESENAPEAFLEIHPDFLEGITNIQAGDTIVLLTWFHQADRTVITCVSRNNFTGPKFGVFSTRSPDRPNPIGIHHVKVLSVANNRITVSALEALDGTPLIDIKPHLKSQG